MVARPERAFILGGSYLVPVKEGLLDRDFITDLKLAGTYDEATFEREYVSKWTGNVESAFFNSDLFDRHRILKLAENESNGRSKSGYYILGIDVGRKDCTTEVCVIKVMPQPKGIPIKQLVNIYSIDAEDFTQQAIKIKRIFNKFHCEAAVVDGNGLGAGLTDLLIYDQQDPDTGDMLYNWGVINDEEREYKKYETPDTIHNALYIMKANAPLNTEMYSYCRTQMQNGRLKFLIPENVAKGKLLEQSQGKKMAKQKRDEYLMPYVKTSILKMEMMNLIEENEGINIILKPNNKNIKHDKFSAFIYGLYYCKLKEAKAKKHTRSFGMLYTAGKK